MQRIYKYAVDPSGMTPMPMGAEILSVGIQDGAPVVWALVDPEELTKVYRRITPYNTGVVVPDNKKTFIGTLQLPSSMVVHLFDLGEMF